ncbi:hypothetical protein F4678DRAFT_441853 [Xylaria arbuscula]|nr:hypothetical protein F4678DRAFT_441853 [Xylaria arbuscula]
MFGGFAPPQLSAEELRQLEGEANWTVKQFLATAVVLYICMSSSSFALRHPAVSIQKQLLFSIIR